MTAMKPTLENRLRVLEDIEEIRKLKAQYCVGCDDDHNPDTLVALFAPDGSWEATGMGRHEGHVAIRKFFADLRASGRIRNSAHNAMNPIIEVDGDTATGHWRLIMLYTGNVPAGKEPAGKKPGGEAQYFRIIGWYREEYVRLFGRWRFKSLYCEVEESAPYPLEASRID